MKTTKTTKNEHYIPTVIETSGRGERAFDLYSRLMKDRIIFINGPIHDDMAAVVVAQMLFLQLENQEAPINIYIMSGGGSVQAALAIYDTMQHVTCPIATYCIGHASSAAAVLLLAGSPGMRHSLPSSRIMIHQPWTGMEGTAKDLQVAYEELQELKDYLYTIMARHTKKTKEQIEKDCDRDYFMSSTEAKDYGIIDKVMTVKKKKNG